MSSRKKCRLRERESPFVQIFRTTPTSTVCPNFYVLAHANGCMFSPQCSYCYLKSSLWFLKEQQAFTNLDSMFEEIRRWIAQDDLETYMLNSGNLSDSLSFETERPLMGRLVELFRTEAKGRPHTLLIVTKGGLKCCQSLLSVPACENVVVSFSVNLDEVSDKYEAGAAPSHERLLASRSLKEAGWRIRIRMDPMILGYSYMPLIKAVRELAPERVTLGSLRAERNLPKFVENGIFKDLRAPEDPKGLARYPVEKRLDLYRPAVEHLKDLCPMGLCEEMPEIWDALGLPKEEKSCNCCM